MKQATKILTLLALLLLTSCHDEPEMVRLSFNATIEPPATESSTPTSKVYLHNEQWIYWEAGDKISIATNATESQTQAELAQVNVGTTGDEYNGVFQARLPESSTRYLALYPYRSHNVISNDFGTVRLELPDTQYRRDDAIADFTFDRVGFPMVAWFNGDDPEYPNLDFHALAGLVRLQFFDNTGSTPKRIKQIDIEADKQISGLVNVADFRTDNPRPVSTLSTPAAKKVIMYCGTGDNGLLLDELRSFYLVLPAYGGENVTTTYSLDITIYTTDGNQCKKSMHPKVRRRSICYPQAMGITEWVASGNGSADPGVSGNGTEERPFKVYTINDLKYIRDCYNSVERTINGIPITPNTHIKIMRSDIVLNTTGVNEWNVGIRNFEGHMTELAHMLHPGIIDSCHNVPLFESIGENGVVEDITLKSATTDNLTNPTGTSPFCLNNAGVIRNCVVTYIPDKASKFNLSIFSPFAGICVTNTGTIEGCRFEGKVEVQSGQNFAGICLHNQSGGQIIGCQSASMTVRFATPASKAVGICYENAAGATVRDCYFASDITGSVVDWAGIVYENSGTVEHCELSSTGHIYTSGRVGGIVRINRGGKVDYCWVNAPLRGSMVGGIVDSLASGKVINCYNSTSAMVTVTTAASIGGGIVGTMTGGSIENSYINDIVIMRQQSNATVGGIVGKATGGTVTNCYSYEAFNHFYGTTSGVTYNYCYIVDGFLSGITNISEDLATSPTGTSGCLVDLLNSHIPSGGQDWKNTSGNLPELKTYTVTP